MRLPFFKLENFFNTWEFKAPYLLCSSDNEALTLQELLSFCDCESKHLWENLNLGYTHSTGHPLLKEEISHLYTRVKKGGIGTFAGAGEALFAAIHVLLQPGDHVIAPTPSYQTFYDLPKALGAEVSLFPIKDIQGEWVFDVDDIKKLIRPNTRLIIINFPHNPTSLTIDKETLEAIVACARAVQAYLLSDEVYRFSERSPLAMPPAADLYEKAISIGVMSKTFGLAGTRIGWLATQDQSLLARCMEFKCYTSLCNSGPSEILSVIALCAKDSIIQRNMQIIEENLSLLDTFFQNYSDIFRWKRPVAGSTAFPELLKPIKIENFVEDLIHEAGVLLLPGSVYEYPGNHFRLGFGRKNMPEALNRLEEYIQSNLR